MKLFLGGVSHRTAPVETRERLAFPEAKLAGALQDLAAQPGITEACILSTCNRVEAIVSASNEDVIDSIVTWLSRTIRRLWTNWFWMDCTAGWGRRR